MDKLVNLDALAHRVARRHRAALRRHGSIRVEYSTAGLINAAAVAKLLEPTYGKFRDVWFREFSSGTPNTVGFGGVTEDEQLVHGRGGTVVHDLFNMEVGVPGVVGRRSTESPLNFPNTSGSSTRRLRPQEHLVDGGPQGVLVGHDLLRQARGLHAAPRT